ncbi:MAG: tetratricopeptide repeat protein [Desulfovibrionaceae bacterium]
MSDKETPRTETAPSRETRRIRGLFSTQNVDNVGTGTTKRKAISKTYWFAEENDQQIVSVQPINNNFVPSGPCTEVPRDDFLRAYHPEPEYYQTKVYPNIKQLEQTLERAEKARSQGQAYSAELEFSSAIELDEDNVRANFGLGLTYMDRGDNTRADDIFQRLVGLEAAYTEEHKHLFNEFGMSLRKAGLLDQAVEYYNRALQVAQNDENLHYNIARAYFERGDAEKCTEHLNTCLKMNPAHAEAKEFVKYVKGLVERVQAEKKGGNGGTVLKADI